MTYSTTYTFTGRTYPNRQWLKSKGARWDAAGRAWVIQGQLLPATLVEARARGLRVATSRDDGWTPEIQELYDQTGQWMGA